MLTNRLAKRYAKAIVEVARDDKKVKEYGQQLQKLHNDLNAHADLMNFMCNPIIRTEAKKEVAAKVFKSELAANVYNFFMLLIDKRRESLLGGIVSEYELLANEAMNIVSAQVTVALPMTADQEKALIKKLEKLTGKTVIIKTKVDKNIMGGVVVRIGDKLIDGSIVRQLDSLKEQLLA